MRKHLFYLSFGFLFFVVFSGPSGITVNGMLGLLLFLVICYAVGNLFVPLIWSNEEKSGRD